MLVLAVTFASTFVTHYLLTPVILLDRLLLILSLLAISLVYSLLTILVMEMLVLSRVNSISQQISNIGSSNDPSRRIALSGQDELVNLVKMINGTLARLQISQDELIAREEKRQWEEKSREATYYISQAASSTLNLEELYHRIHTVLGELMPVDNFFIALYDPAAEIISFPYFVDQYDPPPAPKKPGKGLTEYVLRTGKALLAPPHVFDELVEQGEVENLGTPSIDWLGVPLKVNDGTVGILAVQSYEEEVRFREQEKAILIFVSTQVALAIIRKRADETLARHAREMTALYETSLEINSHLDLSSLLHAVVRRAADLLDARMGGLYFMRPDNEALELVVSHNFPKDYLGTALNLGEGLSGRIAQTGAPMMIDDYLNWCGQAKVFADQPFRRVLGVPMKLAGKLIGVINVTDDEKTGPFSEDEIRLVSLFADQAAIAVENARLFEAAQQELSERKAAEAEAQHRLKRVQALHNIDIAISSSLDIQVTLFVILDQVTAQLGVDAAAVLLLNPQTLILEYAGGRGLRTSALQHTHLRMGEGYAGRAALERRIVFIPDLPAQKTDFIQSPWFASENFIAYFGVPLLAKGQVMGVMEIFHRAPLNPELEWLEFLEALATQTAIAVNNAELFESLQHSNLDLTLAYDTTLEGWSRAVELRDHESKGHAQRVTELALNLARASGVSDDELIHIRRGSLLHDIGMVGIPDHILQKPGALTAEEWAIIRQHPVYANDLLSPIVYLRQALDIPYYHHERWDGSGYPHGLAGERIPLGARIFAVVDVWDALVSDRPYRPAWTDEAARRYLCEQAGMLFDPQVVERFLKIIDRE